MIGIVGGIGPYAGLHLHKVIMDRAAATCDQDYLPVLHINNASSVPDRTEFLLGNVPENPAVSLSEQIQVLYNAGARVIGLSCNTAHAFPIYREITGRVSDLENLVLVNMIDELFLEIQKNKNHRTGLLATLGSYQCGIFREYAASYGIEVSEPDLPVQKMIHDTIYNIKDGIKVTGIVNDRIKTFYHSAIEDYKGKNIRSVILGCTEISMAFDYTDQQCTIYKTVDILAEALIREYRKMA